MHLKQHQENERCFAAERNRCANRRRSAARAATRGYGEAGHAWLLALALFAAALLLAPGTAAAQEEEEEDPFSFDVYGFVKAEHIYDTRQVLQVREGEFNLFPLDEADADGDGRDDNATDNLGIFTFFSRLGVNIDGPELLGAASSANIEADFFGADNTQTSAFRLRRAFINLDWGTHALLVGQEWSPLFTLAVFPRTINTTTGAPFNPFARQPQVRLTYKPGDVQVIGAVAQQRDAFDERGLGAFVDAVTGEGISATGDGEKLQQQAGLPAGHLHVQYLGDALTLGGGAYVRWIRPEIDGDRFRSGAVQGYAEYTGEAFSVMAKGTYGNDMSDHLMLGGYVETVPAGNVLTQDPGDIEYLPTRLFSGWVDLQASSDGPVSVGAFGGYQSQLGVGAVDDARFLRRNSALGANIEDLFRVAPRLNYTAGPLRLGLEVEVTSALYASEIDEEFRPDATDDDERITNVRGNVAVFYVF